MRTLTSLILIFMSITKIQAQENRNPKTIVSIDIQSKLSLKETFEYIVPMDLEHIFQRNKIIPGIDSTSNREAWYKPEMSRIVYFEDGTTCKETLLNLIPFTTFTYKINDFTSSFKLLIKQINGSWTFTESKNGKIHIEWIYEFIPKNFLANHLINTIIKNQMKTTMNNALNIMKDELESGNLYRYNRKVGNW